MRETIRLQAEIPADMAGRRLDQALAELFPQFSRSRLQQWIRTGNARVNGESAKPRATVAGGERVEITAEAEPVVECEPQAIPLRIVHEDAHLIVIDKPAGLVVHPAAGNLDGTLQNALLHHAPGLAALPRAGIIHRLDKDTTGLMVIARTLEAHHALVQALQEREITREYQAVVRGVMTAGGSVDAPIGRHPVDRKRMAVRGNGKPALTHYRVMARYPDHTRVRLQLESGRTHQIRVHMAHIGYPVVGDPVYGGRFRVPKGASETLVRELRQWKRQALHAERLVLQHPASGETVEWSAPLPADMQRLIEVLEQEATAR